MGQIQLAAGNEEGIKDRALSLIKTLRNLFKTYSGADGWGVSLSDTDGQQTQRTLNATTPSQQSLELPTSCCLSIIINSKNNCCIDDIQM